MCQGNGGILQKYFTNVYDLNENALFTGGDINKDTGLAFEIKDAKDIMGIYHPGVTACMGMMMNRTLRFPL